MRDYKPIFNCLLLSCLVLAFNITLRAQNASEKHNVFGAVKCDEEMTILDSIENKLKGYPFTTAYFYVYGGRRDTKRDEVQLRSARMKRYLTENRAIESNRVEIVTAGFREKFTVEVWLVSVGETPPKPKSTVSRRKVRFKKGKMPQWEEPGCYADKSRKPTVSKNQKCEN